MKNIFSCRFDNSGKGDVSGHFERILGWCWGCILPQECCRLPPTYFWATWHQTWAFLISIEKWTVNFLAGLTIPKKETCLLIFSACLVTKVYVKSKLRAGRSVALVSTWKGAGHQHWSSRWYPKARECSTGRSGRRCLVKDGGTTAVQDYQSELQGLGKFIAFVLRQQVIHIAEEVLALGHHLLHCATVKWSVITFFVEKVLLAVGKGVIAAAFATASRKLAVVFKVNAPICFLMVVLTAFSMSNFKSLLPSLMLSKMTIVNSLFISSSWHCKAWPLGELGDRALLLLWFCWFAVFVWLPAMCWTVWLPATCVPLM